jgi:hypothetical protein
VDEETRTHGEIQARLDADHIPGVLDPHGRGDVQCRREILRHKQRLNEIADEHYRQRINVYLPQYAQKMRPKTQGLWDVCSLYTKGMGEPKALEHQDIRAATTYASFASRAIGGIEIGRLFEWQGPTAEEEKALHDAIDAAEEEPEGRKMGSEDALRVPETSWIDPVAEQFELELGDTFLTIRITVQPCHRGSRSRMG